MNSVDKSPQQRLILTFNHKITLFAFFVFPLLCSLGVWQLHRAAEKTQLQEDYAAQHAQPPISLSVDNIASLADYHRVLAQGKFDNEHTWLLDNKQRQGQVGYEVISPFLLEDGNHILVNRGWLPAKNLRAELPEVAPVTGTVTLFAELIAATEHPLLNAKSQQHGWPKIITEIELNTMKQQLEAELLTRYLRLDEASPGAFITGWQPINTSPEKHLGYAVQWFAMAFALIIWFIFASTNIVSYWQDRQQQRKSKI